MKKITFHDQHKNDNIFVQEINHLPDKDQAEKLAEHFSEIPNQYDQLRREDILIEPINSNEIPQLKEVQVWDLLTKIKKTTTINSRCKETYQPEFIKNWQPIYQNL